MRRLQARRRGQMGRRRHKTIAAEAVDKAEALAVADAAGTTADADADGADAGAGGAAGKVGLEPSTPATPRKVSPSPQSSRRLAVHVSGESSGKLSLAESKQPTRASSQRAMSPRGGAVSPGFNGGPGSPMLGGGPEELRLELMERLARRLLDDLEALLPPSRPASRMSECAAAALTLTLRTLSLTLTQTPDPNPNLNPNPQPQS